MLHANLKDHTVRMNDRRKHKQETVQKTSASRPFAKPNEPFFANTTNKFNSLIK
jgi:hypothetical protein